LGHKHQTLNRLVHLRQCYMHVTHTHIYMYCITHDFGGPLHISSLCNVNSFYCFLSGRRPLCTYSDQYDPQKDGEQNTNRPVYTTTILIDQYTLPPYSGQSVLECYCVLIRETGSQIHAVHYALQHLADDLCHWATMAQ